MRPMKLRKASTAAKRARFGGRGAAYATNDGRFGFSKSIHDNGWRVVEFEEGFLKLNWREEEPYRTLTDAVWSIYDEFYAQEKQGPTALDSVLG